MCKMSIIVMVYNQSLQSIFTTLNSIIAQDFDDFEIIVTDDSSRTNYEQEIRHLFEETGFQNYQIIVNEQNVATVRNIIGAMEVARGRFVKDIGAGDMLFERDTLKKMYAYCEENDVRVAFGKIKTYTYHEGRIQTAAFNAPKAAHLYNIEKNPDVLVRQQLLNSDWIPGGAIFFERDYLLAFFKTLAEEYRVKYCEDFVSLLISFNEVIPFYDEYTLWYEWGEGVSTSGDMASRSRMYADHGNLYEGLLAAHPGDPAVRKAYRRFTIKRFIALKTPLYGIAQRMRSRQYLRTSDADSSEEDLAFLKYCLDQA